MAWAPKTRREVFAGVKSLYGTVTGATYTDRIDVRDGPQGKAESYYSIGEFSEDAPGDVRAGATDKAFVRAETTIRFAFRLRPGYRETDRLDARDVLDRAHRATHASAVAGSPLGFEGVWLGATESQNDAQEWVFFDCRTRWTSLFDLTVS